MGQAASSGGCFGSPSTVEVVRYTRPDASKQEEDGARSPHKAAPATHARDAAAAAAAPGAPLPACDAAAALLAAAPAGAPLGVCAAPGAPYLPHVSGPPLPMCDLERVQWMNDIHILDSPPTPELNNILSLICGIFDTQSALIALFGDRRIYVKQAENFREGDFPWYHSFCGWTMANPTPQPLVANPTPQPLIVNDARKDARFCDLPLISAGELGFYAGTPLIASNGHRLGTLCCADPRARDAFDGRQALILANFAELVTKQLEADVALAVRARQVRRASEEAAAAWPLVGGGAVQSHRAAAAAESAPAGSEDEDGGDSSGGESCVLCVSAGSGPEWTVVHATAEVEGVAGLPTSAVVGRPLWSLFCAAPDALSEQRARDAAGDAMRGGRRFGLQGATLAVLGDASPSGCFNLEFTCVRAGSRALGWGEEGAGRCTLAVLGDASPSGCFDLEFTCVRAGSRALGWGEEGAGRCTLAVLGDASPSGYFDLEFTPASAEGPLHPGGPRVALPTYLPDGPSAASSPDSVYFVTARRSCSSGAPSTCSLPLAPAPAAAPPPAAGGGAKSDVVPLPRGWAAGGGGAGGGASGAGGSGRLSGAVLRRRAGEAFDGLKLGAAIAAGSYGRVYKGSYWGTKVAVKVIDGDAVLRRDPETGASLEAVLSLSLAHPNIARTLAWRTVHGEHRLRLEQPKKLLGETLPEPAGLARVQGIRAAGGGGAAPPSLHAPPPAAGRASGRASSAASSAAAPPAGAGAGPSPRVIIYDDMSPSFATPGAQGAAAGGGGGRAGDGGGEGGGQGDPSKGQTWIVVRASLEYCDKGCLQDAIDRGWLRDSPSFTTGRPNILAVLTTAREIASGMAYLHSRDIVHGDLSAYNVMLASTGGEAAYGGRGFVAKVADFGLSRMLDGCSKVETKTYGTMTAMAPEVISKGLVSKAADVYSWGVLLWQMCVGVRPWAGMSHAAVVQAVCVDRRRLEFGPETPHGVALLASACMARDPSERPSFSDVIDILEPLNAAVAAAGGGGGGGGGPLPAGGAGSGAEAPATPAARDGGRGGGGAPRPSFSDVIDILEPLNAAVAAAGGGGSGGGGGCAPLPAGAGGSGAEAPATPAARDGGGGGRGGGGGGAPASG
ncbi:MAG: hypothetical protein J3K34DRAFT_519492 [Monoraphidium minutum]|nr:MAG: hypothetical protein J3K34DRAFT_519492 [Monoraphidium minutum]